MRPEALEKAEHQLDAARAAYQRLMDAGAAGDREENDIDAQRRAWSDFLSAFYRVYSALNAGAAKSDTSKAFMAEANAVRDQEPLLAYLYAARHENEHGLAPIVAHQKRAAMFSERPVRSADRRFEVLRLASQIPGRGGKVYERPYRFEGNDLIRSAITYFAALALGHTERLVQKAAQLPR